MSTHLAELASLVTALNNKGINPSLTFDTETGHLETITVEDKTFNSLICFAEEHRPKLGEKAQHILNERNTNKPVNVKHTDLGKSGDLLFMSLNYGTTTINGQKVESTHRDDSVFEFNLVNGQTVIVNLWAMNSNINPELCASITKAPNKH